MSANSPNVGASVMRFYINFETLPSGNTDIALGGGGATIAFRSATSTIVAKSSAAADSNGFTVTTDTWYRIDTKFDAAGDTLDVQVNGTALNQVAATGDPVNLLSVGLHDSVSGEMFVADVALANALTDYPIGRGFVHPFICTADGTHNIAGANQFERGTSGTDITNGTTDAHALIGKVPLDDTTPGTNFINMVAPANATDYTEHVLGPAPGIATPLFGPRGVEVIVGIHQADTGTGNIEIRLNDNGTEGTVYSATAEAGSTTIVYKRAHFADPPSAATAWHANNDGSNGDFRDLRVRFGSPSGGVDADPDQYLDCVLVEAEFAEDLAIWEFPALSTPETGDLLAVVDDPAGTPTSKKLALSDFISTLLFTQVAIQVKTVGSGTYTPTTGMKKVLVIGVGGGGAGAGGVNTDSSGGGGGGGGTCIRLLTAAQIGASKAYVVGAAGAATTVDTGTLLNAGGGSNGTAGSQAGGLGLSSGGGAGGTASNGDLNIPGTPGSTGTTFSGTDGMGGTGGSSVFGFGAAAGGSNVAGAAGQAYGGGGSGGHASGTANRDGGAGAAGILYFIEFLAV